MPTELKNATTEVHYEDRGNEGSENSNPYSSWRRRPLSSLRWQLGFVYSLLICTLLILFSLWTTYAISHTTAQSVLFFSLQVAVFVLIAVGIFILFFLTNLLVQPLRQMSDAAQAITLGDLQQRERLQPLMKGDDEVSKTAASLTIMGDQLDQASQKQQSSEQRFRRLISDASHQLRTPLTSIRGFTEVLMRGAKDDPETVQRVLKLIKNEAERMTRMINDLLMLARLDSGNTVEKQYVDLLDLAVEGVEQTKVLATDGREVTIYFATDERLGVQANADQLKQVIHILVENALKYGRPAPEGWIRLQLDREDGHALMQIIDNGKGIHQDDLPHIFDRFYRGEHMPVYEPPWKVPQGTGLGLAIARAIVLAHMGYITVLSTPDTETVFTVKLPCVAE